METFLRDHFQFVNGKLFETVILIKLLSIYLLLKHVKLLDFFPYFCPLFHVPLCSKLSKGTGQKGTQDPPPLYIMSCVLILCFKTPVLNFRSCNAQHQEIYMIDI